MVAILLPRTTNPRLIGIITFVIVLILWLGLAFVRKFL